MKTTFLCSIPPIQSAIKISGEGSIRLQVDIPETELPNAIKILMAKGKIIKTSMEWEGE